MRKLTGHGEELGLRVKKREEVENETQISGLSSQGGGSSPVLGHVKEEKFKSSAWGALTSNHSS